MYYYFYHIFTTCYKHIIKSKECIIFFKTLGNRFIATGDYNAKYMQCRPRLILLKECKFLKAIEAMNLANVSTRGFIWPSDKIPDLILILLYFDIIKGISKDYCRTESYLELSSDHSRIIIRINNKIITKDKPCTLHHVKTNWPYFQELLMTTLDNSIPLKTDDDIICTIGSFNHIVQQIAWNAISYTNRILNISSEYSSSVENKLAEIRKEICKL